MRRIYHRHKEKINYFIVGVWNTIFGYGIYALLYYAFSPSVHYLLLLLPSYIISITNAYIGYKIFVFKTKGNYLKEYLKFYVVYAFGLVVNLLLLPLFVEVSGLNPVVAQAMVIPFMVCVSYLGHKHFSFRVG